MATKTASKPKKKQEKVKRPPLLGNNLEQQYIRPKSIDISDRAFMAVIFSIIMAFMIYIFTRLDNKIDNLEGKINNRIDKLESKIDKILLHLLNKK